MNCNNGLGHGYNFNITVLIGHTVVRIVYGIMSYGGISAVVIDRLLPGRTYNFETRHECAPDLGKFSNKREVNATTLPEGNAFNGSLFAIIVVYKFLNV